MSSILQNCVNYFSKVTGDIYIDSTRSGPIRNDRLFGLSSRLKNVDHTPVPIMATDVYVELRGKFTCEFSFKSTKGVPFHYMYLPSSLFESAKEGDTICFYFDDRLFELCCNQRSHPYPSGASWTFENFLASIKAQVLASHAQFLFNEDIEDEPQLMGELVGSSWVQLNSPTGQERDFLFYTQDIELNGPYQQLQVRNAWRVEQKHNVTDCLIFNFHAGLDIAISDIALIQSEGFNGLHQIWVLIPHQPEKNIFPEGVSEIALGYQPVNDTSMCRMLPFEKLVFDKATFDPTKGHRTPFYHYGQYSLYTVYNILLTVDLSYNRDHFLQLIVKQAIP